MTLHLSQSQPQNAADLILTEPGLSPIYGAVIESRRIFARIKSYVVYRLAASLTLVVTLSLVVFISGCAIDPLFVIILALLNDVSMIPVAYDNAEATKRPQLPRATNLVLLSSFFASIQTAFSMILFYAIAQDGRTNDGGFTDFSLQGTNSCSGATKGTIWLHLLLSTELMIFSARAPSFFWKSMPSWKLIVSVLATVGPLGCLLARFYSEYLVSGSTIGWLWLFNVVVFIVVDVLKVALKAVIGDRAGETIKDSELLAVEAQGETSEARQQLQKALRYQVHRESVLSEDERSHSIIVTDRSNRIKTLSNLSWNDGFVRQPNISNVPL